MSNSHSVDCAKAVITSPTECKCQCGGAFHGGPNTARARALLREQDQKKYSKRQVSDAKRKARTAAGNSASSSLKTRAYTDYIGFSTIDGLIRVGSSQDQQKTRDFIGTVVMPFAAEINVSTLDSQQKKLVKDFVFQQHILCTLCVNILRIVSDSSAVTHEVCDEVVDAVLSSIGIGSDSQDAVDVAIRVAVSASATAIVSSDLVTSGAAFLQLIGAITCPDINEHPEVIKYCLTPLQNTWTDSAVTQWLTDSPQDLDALVEAIEGP